MPAPAVVAPAVVAPAVVAPPVVAPPVVAPPVVAPPVVAPPVPAPAPAPHAPGPHAAQAAAVRARYRRAMWKRVEYVALLSGNTHLLGACRQAPNRAAIDALLTHPSLAHLSAACLNAAAIHRNCTNSSVAARKRREGVAGAPPARRPPPGRQRLRGALLSFSISDRRSQARHGQRRPRTGALGAILCFGQNEGARCKRGTGGCFLAPEPVLNFPFYWLLALTESRVRQGPGPHSRSARTHGRTSAPSPRSSPALARAVRVMPASTVVSLPPAPPPSASPEAFRDWLWEVSLLGEQGCLSDSIARLTCSWDVSMYRFFFQAGTPQA